MTTKFVGFKESLIPCLRTSFVSRIDLRIAFKQLFSTITKMYWLGTVVNDLVFIDATMSMKVKNIANCLKMILLKPSSRAYYITMLIYSLMSLDPWFVTI